MSRSKFQLFISSYIFSCVKNQTTSHVGIHIGNHSALVFCPHTNPHNHPPLSLAINHRSFTRGNGVVWTWSPQKILHRHQCWRQLALWWSTSTRRDIQEFLGKKKRIIPWWSRSSVCFVPVFFCVVFVDVVWNALWHDNYCTNFLLITWLRGVICSDFVHGTFILQVNSSN